MLMLLRHWFLKSLSYLSKISYTNNNINVTEILFSIKIKKYMVTQQIFLKFSLCQWYIYIFLKKISLRYKKNTNMNTYIDLINLNTTDNLIMHQCWNHS